MNIWVLSTYLVGSTLFLVKDNHMQLVNPITFQDATGNLTAADTSEPVDIDSYRIVVIYLDITTLTTADGDDEVDFYIQTTYDDDNLIWFDVENVHFANADDGTTPTKILIYDSHQSAAVVRDATDGTLADDSKLDIPLGIKIRIKTAVTGATAPTYAYQAHGIKRN